jgi:glycine/D-amino acid oxidase-like deaminating enzyme/nitrite reductase/ring-hydroxylating ferredoxin subunit
MNSTDNFPESTSGFHDSYWTDSAHRPDYKAIDSDVNADVVIVGAGIAGLTVAYCLSKEGKSVVVLDDGDIGSGETGRTTAHIVNAIDDRYFEIEKTFGEEKARLSAESHTAAIAFIEETCKNEGIMCDFLRVDGYLFLHTSDKITTLQKELESTRKAGIRTQLLPEAPAMKVQTGPCLHFPGQAQFHPMKYIIGLCESITRAGGKIYCRSHVDVISKEGVEANGFRVTAQEIVVATNSPINDRVTMHTKQHPYRTYVVAAEIPRGSVPPALWWDTGDQESVWVSKPYHYVRTQPFNDSSDLLIVGGEDHKTGQANREDIPEEERYKRLEYWAKAHFPMITNIAYTWSGQVMEPVDMLGYIGLNPGDDNIYIVTGDSGNGMTHGTIAGMLIADIIAGRPNPWKELYDPSRITLSTTPDFLREVANMAAQYKDYFSPGDIESLQQLPVGSGAIIRTAAMKVAVYKDDSEKVHAFSAVCPHLGCYVRWNNDEKSFDCPCHGSRFTCHGKVVNGPSLTDLKPFDLKMMDEARKGDYLSAKE